MHVKRYAFRTIISWTLLLAFICLTHPQKLPVLFFIVPFVLLFMALVNLWGLVAALVHRFWGKNPSLTEKKRLRYTICGGMVLFVVLQSLGQLTIRDVITILAIAAVGYLYIGRSRSDVVGR